MILCTSATCRTQEPTQGNSLLCDDCRDRLHLTIRWIEFHLAHLTTVKAVRPQMVSTAGGFESASPANDDVIVMLDPRSAAVGVGRFHTGPDDDPKPPLSAPAVLGGWALMAWEGRTPPSLRDFMPRPCTVRDAVSELLTALGWICGQDWVHDFADEVGQLNRQLRAATGEAPPKPVASCVRSVGTWEDGEGPPQLCGGGIVLWERPATDTRPATAGARCLTCSASYTGFELIDLAKGRGERP
jgi:hypothetical protein